MAIGGLSYAFPSRQMAVGWYQDPVTTPCGDRKSTRLNSSHSQISYAVFCLKKKKNESTNTKFFFLNSCKQNDPTFTNNNLYPPPDRVREFHVETWIRTAATVGAGGSQSHNR